MAAASVPDTPLSRVLSRLKGVVPMAGGYVARCPAHDDQHASLKIDINQDGSVLLHCHAGCGKPALLAALGLTFADLFAEAGAQHTTLQLVATYPYRALDGTVLYEVCRYHPKAFKQRRPDGAGGWKWDMTPFKGGKGRVPYRLPELKGRSTVFVVEGEKDADRLWADGLPATTNAGGALKWGPAETRALKQAGVHRVILLPDNDETGKEHAERVAAAVRTTGLAVSVIELPGLPPHGDVSDWLGNGHTKADLDALVAATPYVVTQKPPLTAPAPPSAAPTSSPSPGPADYHQSDLGNAEAFRDRFGGRVRYDSHREEWLVWADHIWRANAQADIRALAHMHVRLWQQEAANLEDYNKRAELLKYTLKLERGGCFDAMLREARVLTPIAVDGGWDADPWLLGCPNGVLDLHTGVLRAGTRADRITKQTGVFYDPLATCPRWIQFLTEVFDGDKDVVQYLQRAVGYSLTGIISEQCFFMAHGSGANGKSVLLTTLDYVFGDYAHTTDIRTFTGGEGVTYELAQLEGRRLIMTSETRTRSALNEQALKNFTGGEKVEAQHKFGHPFRFTPVGKVWFAVNHAPKVYDESVGFWRRVRMIPFERTFQGSAEDRELGKKLRTEAAGILTWAVQGCLAWQADGLTPPAKVVEATAEYQRAEDPVTDFLEACCMVQEGLSAGGGHLFTTYKRWAERQGVKTERDGLLSASDFGRRVSTRFSKLRTVRGVRYQGVAVRPTGLYDEVEDEEE